MVNRPVKIFSGAKFPVYEVRTFIIYVCKDVLKHIFLRYRATPGKVS